MDDASRNRTIVHITRNRILNSTTRELVLEASDSSQLPSYEAGAHIDIHLPGIGVRQYSLVRPFQAGEPYVIAVQREEGGRGGSRWIHQHLEVGATLEISAPRNHFPLVPAPKTLLIAGGIGITPLFCMAETCEREGRDHLLVVCSRSEETLVYYEDLLGPRRLGQVQFVLDGGDPARGLDIPALLRAQPQGTHVYCCGPSGLMAAVREAGRSIAGLSLHFEAFGADPTPLGMQEGEAFVVACRTSGLTIEIGPGESILDRLIEAGLDVDHSCREGYCGTCATRWLAGTPIHRDTCLGEVERDRYVAVCTARAVPGAALVLDL